LPAGGRREPRIAQRFSRLEDRALHQKNIQVAIAIVVEESHAGAHDLGQVELAGGSREMLESESGLSSRFPELDTRRMDGLPAGAAGQKANPERGGERRDGESPGPHRTALSSTLRKYVSICPSSWVCPFDRACWPASRRYRSARG